MSTSEFVVPTSQIDIAGWQSDSKGMPLLLLHGSGSSKAIFQRQFESALADRYRLIAIDLPGHGASDNAAFPDISYTISGLAKTIGAVIDALEIEQLAIFGWSLGGHIAIQLAASHPGIAGLMLTGTPPIGRGSLAALRGFHARWDMLLASKEMFSARDAQRFVQLCYGNDHAPARLAEVLRADGRLRSTCLRSMLRGDGVDQKRIVEQCRVPVAMVNGADDPIIRRSYIESLAYAQLWQEQCHTIADAAHAPFLEQPERFNRLLGMFLKDVERHAHSAEYQSAARRA